MLGLQVDISPDIFKLKAMGLKFEEQQQPSPDVNTAIAV
jgi:hypothetical protein